MPTSYLPLTEENEILINPNIKGVLAIAAFQEGSITGLLAIDTDEINNLSKMEDRKLHELALAWIMEYGGTVKLIWRMKNCV